jgi:chromosome partitioning protein
MLSAGPPESRQSQSQVRKGMVVRMSKVISVSNQKGGVGKTTTTCNLAAGLKKKGFRVLIIDLDPQGNLGFSIGAEVDTSATIYDVLKGDVKTQFAIQKTDTADLIPSSILLSGIELEFTNTGREFLLKESIKPIQELYDYILLDTPPALGILTINAFTASDYIIVPMLSDIFSLQGIAQLYETVERVKKYCNARLSIAGILLTKYNPRTRLAREIRGTAELIGQDLNIPVFESNIRNSVVASEAQSVQDNLLDYAPNSSIAKDYMAFTEELLSKGV